MDVPTTRGRAPGRRRPRALLALLALLPALAACGAGAARGGPGSSLTPDLIGLDEIEASTTTNAWDLITQVRPNWLRGRGTPSLRTAQIPLPVVYLDDRRQGDLNVLRSFPTGGIAELRYINATTATIRAQLISVPARLARSARRLTLHLPQHWPWELAWQQLLAGALRARPEAA